jgi:TDG/mug DNA glycosylase family protein
MTAPVLPDVLQRGLDVVLCGTAPSRISRQVGAYYATPSNLFWPTLHAIGLTPRRLAPPEYARVLGFGIGLTDLNKTEWGSDAELTRAAFDVAGLRAKLVRFKPACVAFTSKTAGRAFFGRPVAYGRQPETLLGIAWFVLASPSGRARGYWDPAPWHELGAFVTARRCARAGDGRRASRARAAGPGPRGRPDGAA